MIEHFFNDARRRHPQSIVERLSPGALAKASAHSWPDNVRELQHFIERSVVLGRSREIAEADLPFSAPAKAGTETSSHGDVLPLREVQRRYAVCAYERVGGKMHTADKLDIDTTTLAKPPHGGKDDGATK